jgi:hypothetical protein
MFTNSLQYKQFPYVQIVDGHCKKRFKSRADFVYIPYPYYQPQTYFKPLDIVNNYVLDKIAFEGVPPTTLYTSRL